MLTTTRKKPPETSLHKYLQQPDVNNNQWKTRGTGEINVILCDEEIKLTEELKLYLLYFTHVSAGSPKFSLSQFSNLPIKEE